MATMVESPATNPESPMEQESDMMYPCKGCGEILEEGKAFELAGHRWHIDCFRCNTCGTVLDSDANLLLLGDGSLICNNCTYSCNACGSKIEDLAILTGDQAFCATCFRCRNCKKKIENLRYARTSQGIFCMSCHESLMARRRKKPKAAPRQAQGDVNGAPAPIEKALPSLPPGAVQEGAFSPEIETPPSDTYSNALAARSSSPDKPLKSRRDVPSTNLKRDVSPASDEARRDGPTLPASTYREPKTSQLSSDEDDGEERDCLPMAFDPTPVPAPPPISRKRVPQPADPPPSRVSTEGRPRDYFSGRMSARSIHRDALRDEKASSSRSVSTEREASHAPQAVSQAKHSPHIAYQEKGRNQRRTTSGQNTPASASFTQSPLVSTAQDSRPERPKPQHLNTASFTLHNNDTFKLQEVPKSKKAASRRGSKAGANSPTVVSPVEPGSANGERPPNRVLSTSPMSVESTNSDVNPFDDPKLRDAAPSAQFPTPPKHADRPARGDSLAAATLKAGSSRHSIPEPPTPTIIREKLQPSHERNGSASSVPNSFVDAQSTISPTESRSKQLEPSPPLLRSTFDMPPPRASSRPTAPSKSVAASDFVAPREAPPLPPPAQPPVGHYRDHASVSTTQSSEARSDDRMSPALRSAGLPKHSAESGFSMEEEMARILRGDKSEKGSEGSQGASSVLRRVSNAVKHGRSFSDRGLSSLSGKSPINGSMEVGSPMTISSPLMTSPTGTESPEALKMQLRRAQQRLAELEAEKNGLVEKVNSSAEIKQANSELREKRSTMAFLDSQREMVVRELEIMTEHLSKAKDSNHRLDITSLKNDMLRELAGSLQKLKDSMAGQIEDLVHKRNELTDEISNLIQMKDKGFQEYESLSGKNAQLLEMNNQLVHNIQEMYKANRVPNGHAGGSIDDGRSGMTNGLGICHPGGGKAETPGQSELRNLNLVSTESSMPNLLQETEAEPATVLTAPQVVNIRKGQPKKFNWRKGGEKMAKNVTKGIKGAFVGTDRLPVGDRDISMPYNQTQGQAMPGSEHSSLSGRQGSEVKVDGRPGGAGFGFFGQKTAGLKAGALGTLKTSSGTNLAISADASVLFGSELECRCEYENRIVPSVVMRCIEEVESRGMDVEGVYRKSGGSGQVKTVQAGFEREDKYDISDPDLDIHAVTSTLKQYFRRLPTPLITYDIYDSLLEAGQVKEKERQLQALRQAVADLPEHHRNCLEFLVQHLARVMAHEKENLMTPLNLAVVFAPTIMRPPSIEREMSDMQAQRIAVQAMLDHHLALFPEEE